MCVSPQSAAAASVCNTQAQSPFLEAAPSLTPGKFYLGQTLAQILLKWV